MDTVYIVMQSKGAEFTYGLRGEPGRCFEAKVVILFLNFLKAGRHPPTGGLQDISYKQPHPK